MKKINKNEQNAKKLLKICVSVVVAISKRHKSVIKYPLDLHICPQALLILPIPRLINPFLPTIINRGIHEKDNSEENT